LDKADAWPRQTESALPPTYELQSCWLMWPTNECGMAKPNAASGSGSAEVTCALVASAVAAVFSCEPAALAQDSNEALAEELANPLAELGSLPFLGNYNGDLGPERDGSQWFVNMLNQSGLFPGEDSLTRCDSCRRVST
jgi:hypothetical protein